MVNPDQSKSRKVFVTLQPIPELLPLDFVHIPMGINPAAMQELCFIGSGPDGEVGGEFDCCTQISSIFQRILC